MNGVRLLLTFLAIPMTVLAAPPRKQAESDSHVVPPPPPREFRGAWVATVANIDWPSKAGLSTQEQQAELLAILDAAVRLKLNAIVFQARPACDALYASPHEPWSEYLTGTMGQAPEPFYDPLEFVVREAHARGLELHVWFNPFRARHSTGKSPAAADHVSRKRPELVRQYGKNLWLDPGDPQAQGYSLEVMLDVVRRYDLDAVHIDDYFYPYREKDAQGKWIEFPDETTYQAYIKSGGKLSRDDWRRDNVNRFVKRLHESIKQVKPTVRFGISPFGIWRPGHPPGIQGLDQYAELYADARLWLNEGWCDYYAPQLYWRIDPPAQSFPALLAWWKDENHKRRHLWPGLFTSKLIDNVWPADEIVRQIEITRGAGDAEGNIHFSMKALLRNEGKLAETLQRGLYAEAALVPASSWLDDRPPGAPILTTSVDQETSQLHLAWQAAEGELPRLYVVQMRALGQWRTVVLPAARTTYNIPLRDGRLPLDAAAVSAVDAVGNQGPAAVWTPPAGEKNSEKRR